MPHGITQCCLPPKEVKSKFFAATGSGDFPALPQPKLALDLATA